MLCYAHVHGARASLALLDIEFHRVVLPNGLFHAGHVHKNFVSASLHFNETEAFGLIEEFYCTFLHLIVVKLNIYRLCGKEYRLLTE